METNQKVVNYQRGASGVFAFGENVTTGISSLFYVPCQFDEGLSTALGTIATNAKEKQRLFTQGGNKACYIYQNEMDDSKTLSVNYNDDAIYWQQMAVKLVDKNLLTNLLTGERFMDGSDVVTVVGTNGTKIIADNFGRKKVTTNNSPYNLFNYVGRMMIPQSDDGTGKPIFTNNIDNDGNKVNGKTVGLEAIYTYDDNTVWGVRFIFCMPKKPTFTDGQPNKVALEFDVYCDTHIIEKPLTDGISAPDVLSTTGTDAVYAVNADYMVENNVSYNTGTIAIATDGVVTGSGTTFTAAMVGGTLTVLGVDYIVNTFTSATSIKVLTPPAVAVVAGTSYKIVYASTTLSAPTFTGTTGKVAAVINTLNGKVGIYKHNGTSWSTGAVTSVLGAGCQIYGAKVGNRTDVIPTAKSGYVAIATAGATGVAVASATKTKTTGSGIENYIFNNRYFDLGTLAFIDYTM